MEVFHTLQSEVDIESLSFIIQEKVVETYVIQLLLLFSTFVDIHIGQVILSSQTLILSFKISLN